ncbi:15121_t:CDS:1, partial [Funneliformis mosseae]
MVRNNKSQNESDLNSNIAESSSAATQRQNADKPLRTYKRSPLPSINKVFESVPILDK